MNEAPSAASTAEQALPQTQAAAQGHAVSETYSRGYLAYVLGMAFAINIFNIADRQMLGIVLQPLKVEFALTDLQLGLLSGLVFAVIYATMGIPLGSLADRISRRNLTAACLALWSAMTVISGFAKNVMHLVLARVGVALGESGFSPSIQSLLSDYFPPSKRATALSVWGLGSPLGSLVGFALGGYFAQHYGWRSAFIAVGAPGLVLALLFLFTVREPARGGAERRRDDTTPPSIGAGIRFAWNTRSMRYLMLGAGMHLFVFYGLGAWLAPFFLRTHHMPLAQAGLYLGLITGVLGGAGTLMGGYLSDRLGRSDPRWYAWVSALCLLVMVPFGLGMYLAPSASSSLAFGCVMGFLGAVWLAPTFAIVQLLAPLRMRGVAAGILIFTQVMIGNGGGPAVAGWLSDLWAPRFGSDSLRWALFAVFFVELFAVALFYLAGRFLPSDLTRSHATARRVDRPTDY